MHCLFFICTINALKLNAPMDFQVSVLPSSGINYPAGNWDWCSPSRPYYNLWVSVAGVGRLQVDEQAFDVASGFACLLHPQDSTLGIKDADVSFCNISLHFEFQPHGKSLAWLERFQRKPTRLRNLNVIRELMRYMTDLMKSEGAKAQAEANLLGAQVLRIFARDWELGPEEPLDQLVRKVARTLREHPELPWTLGEMAEEVELSVSQFTRRFSIIFGVPPNAYLIQERIEKAKGMLQETRLSVGEISEILGYADVAFFSRQFKSLVGISPNGFRKVL